MPRARPNPLRQVPEGGIAVCVAKRERGKAVSRVTKVEHALASIQPCPKCAAPTRERKSNRGAFLGCITYPACNGTINIPTTSEVR